MEIKTYLPLTYSVDENYKSDKFIKLRLRVCHDGKNPNGSAFKLTDLVSHKDSLEESPILAHIYESEEGTPELGGHDFIIERNKFDSTTYKKVYLEQPVGVIPKDNNFEITELDGVHYINVDGYIWRGYSNYCEELINMSEEFKISMEVDVLSYSYDSENDCYDINNFIYKAVTLLNDSFGTGMKNARAQVQEFSNSHNNEMYKLIQNELSKEFSLKNNKKGAEVTMDIEKILSEFSITRDQLDFDITDDMSEEILREKIKAYVEQENEESDSEESETGEKDTAEDSKDSSEVKPVVMGCNEKRKKIACQLEEDCFIVDIFDTFVIYEKYEEDDNKFFKVGYTIDGEGDISFTGEPEEMFIEFLTSEEKNNLDEMRANYSRIISENQKLVEYKNNNEATIRKNSLAEIFNVFDDELSENVEYVNLKNNNSEYSVTEVEEKCYSILGRKNAKFSSNKKSSVVRTAYNNHEENPMVDKPYGGLFDLYHNK